NRAAVIARSAATSNLSAPPHFYCAAQQPKRRTGGLDHQPRPRRWPGASRMRNMSDTIERLSAFRRHSGASPMADARNRLRDLADFGANPGALRARLYLPQALGRNAPLVVVLHGCTQTAAGYDHGAGWSQLADRQ